jgi:membrane-associated phospholipid phosphatase
MKTLITVLIIAAAADKPLIDTVQRNRSHFSDEFAHRVTPLGGHDALLISAGMFGAGWLAHDDRLRAAGLESVEAQLIASQLLVPVLKRAAGRARPFTDEGTYHFEPFRSRDDAHRSFPSSHATTAFAAATAIAAHYDNRVVPTIVYSLATGVAFARVNDNVHFPSDVVAGALLGHLVANGVVARHGFIVLPQRNGVMVVYRRAGE